MFESSSQKTKVDNQTFFIVLRKCLVTSTDLFIYSLVTCFSKIIRFYKFQSERILVYFYFGHSGCLKN